MLSEKRGITGAYAWALADNSVATGVGATTAGINSTAIGRSADARASSSIAPGDRSRARYENEMNIDIGHNGSQISMRAISGLFDGMNSDEAVNRKQLDEVDQKAQGYASDAKTEAIEEITRLREELEQEKKRGFWSRLFRK